MSEKSAFRPCGRDLVEFFNSTGWAFLVQVDYFRVARHPLTNCAQVNGWSSFDCLQPGGECPTTVSRTLINHARNLLRWAIR
jgi:hypothetical protein